MSSPLRSMAFWGRIPSVPHLQRLIRKLPHLIAVSVLSAALAACGGDTPTVTTHGGLDSCVTDPKVCNADDLCRLALFEEDGIKRWNEDNLRWQPYVREAQSRGLRCGL